MSESANAARSITRSPDEDELNARDTGSFDSAGDALANLAPAATRGSGCELDRRLVQLVVIVGYSLEQIRADSLLKREGMFTVQA